MCLNNSLLRCVELHLPLGRSSDHSQQVTGSLSPVTLMLGWLRGTMQGAHECEQCMDSFWFHGCGDHVSRKASCCCVQMEPASNPARASGPCLEFRAGAVTCASCMGQSGMTGWSEAGWPHGAPGMRMSAHTAVTSWWLRSTDPRRSPPPEYQRAWCSVPSRTCCRFS